MTGSGGAGSEERPICFQSVPLTNQKITQKTIRETENPVYIIVASNRILLIVVFTLTNISTLIVKSSHYRITGRRSVKYWYNHSLLYCCRNFLTRHSENLNKQIY